MSVKTKLLNDVGIKSLESVFIIISEKDAPVLLVLDSKQRPYFFTFNASVQSLLDYVKLETKPTSAEPEDEAGEETGVPGENAGEGAGALEEDVGEETGQPGGEAEDTVQQIIEDAPESTGPVG